MSKIALKPRVSEKTYALSEQTNTYVFEVPKGANKHGVAEAVASQFDVTVTNVRMAANPAKVRRAYKKRGRFIMASTAGIRKAYVTLKAGDKLPIFSAVEEDSKDAKKTKETK